MRTLSHLYAIFGVVLFSMTISGCNRSGTEPSTKSVGKDNSTSESEWIYREANALFKETKHRLVVMRERKSNPVLWRGFGPELSGFSGGEKLGSLTGIASELFPGHLAMLVQRYETVDSNGPRLTALKELLADTDLSRLKELNTNTQETRKKLGISGPSAERIEVRMNFEVGMALLIHHLLPQIEDDQKNPRSLSTLEREDALACYHRIHKMVTDAKEANQKLQDSGLPEKFQQDSYAKAMERATEILVSKTSARPAERLPEGSEKKEDHQSLRAEERPTRNAARLLFLGQLKSYQRFAMEEDPSHLKMLKTYRSGIEHIAAYLDSKSSLELRKEVNLLLDASLTLHTSIEQYASSLIPKLDMNASISAISAKALSESMTQCAELLTSLEKASPKTDDPSDEEVMLKHTKPTPLARTPMWMELLSARQAKVDPHTRVLAFLLRVLEVRFDQTVSRIGATEAQKQLDSLNYRNWAKATKPVLANLQLEQLPDKDKQAVLKKVRDSLVDCLAADLDPSKGTLATADPGPGVTNEQKLLEGLPVAAASEAVRTLGVKKADAEGAGFGRFAIWQLLESPPK